MTCNVSVIGTMCLVISILMYFTPLDHCVLCMILNYVIIITLAMELSFGACVISYFRYKSNLHIDITANDPRYSESHLPTLELIYFYMCLYFMGLGFMFALLVAGLIGISFGIHKTNLSGFSFTKLQEV